MRKKPPFFIWWIILFLLLASCSDNGDSSKTNLSASSLKQSESIPVRIAEVKARKMERKIDFVGSLLAYEETTLSSEVDGKVERIFKDFGDRVSKGEILLKIDSETFQIEYERALADLRQSLASLGLKENQREEALNVEDVSYVKRAKANLTDAGVNSSRAKELLQKELISRQQYDDAKTRYDIAHADYLKSVEEARSQLAIVKNRRAALALARKKIADSEIRSPLAGFVTKKLVSQGEYMKVGTPVISIAKIDPLKLRGDLPERYASEVKLGQSIRAQVEAFPNRIFEGKIVRISPQSNVENRSFTIEGIISNSSLLLKAGFFASASIITKVSNSASMIPIESVISFAGLKKVYVIIDNKAYERIVETGGELGEEIEITKGLDQSGKVAVTGLSKLYNGVKVTIQ